MEKMLDRISKELQVCLGALYHDFEELEKEIENLKGEVTSRNI